jgi:hypothetical protein
MSLEPRVMMQNLEARVVSALGLESARKLDADDGWELCRYGLRDRASQILLPLDNRFLLFVKSRGLNQRDLPKLSTFIRHKSSNGLLSVVIQRSSPLARDREFVKREMRAYSVMLMHELLQHECRRLLGNPEIESNPFPYFVEPIVDDKSALKKLGDWLMAESDSSEDDFEIQGKRNVAVLLAPAGLGKTSVARELVRSILLRPEHDVLPLLIEPGQWPSLNPNEPVTPWSVIKHALAVSGHNAVPQESFDLFARAGCIVIIFDGLDEVGSIRGGTVTPVDVITHFRHLAVDSACRVLVTSRDGLWSEMPPEFRQPIQEFHLLPFRNQEIGRYREKRFPKPRSPARRRFDEILDTVTRTAHPYGTSRIQPEERAPAAPLILHLVATEAEENSNSGDYGLEDTKYKNPLYAITYGILNREHTRRNLCLTPAQQFMMISTLVIEMGDGPYELSDIRTAVDYAFGNSLEDTKFNVVLIHPLLKRISSGTFCFRFDYLTHFAPAVWLCDYLIGDRRDTIVERYLSDIAGRSSPVSGHVADLLREIEWIPYVAAHVERMKNGDLSHRAITPFLWELAQSLMPPPNNAARSLRTLKMGNLFGKQDKDQIIFAGLPFSGPIAYMDLRRVSFKECTFQNCEWISCEAGQDTEFNNCRFKGRFVQVASPGLRSGIFDPLTEDNVDEDTRSDLENLLGRRGLLTTTSAAVRGMLISLLGELRPAGFFIPRIRDELCARFVGPLLVRNHIIERLVANGVLENDAVGRLRVMNKHSASVMALLDNGQLNGRLRVVEQEVTKHFQKGA